MRNAQPGCQVQNWRVASSRSHQGGIRERQRASSTKIRTCLLSIPCALRRILVDGYNIGACPQPRCWRICCFLLSHALGIGRVSFVLCCTQPMTLFRCFKIVQDAQALFGIELGGRLNGYDEPSRG
ncbi:hypothetical protein BBK36DRAFT_1043500 [Trichoderma citrinoviride]|uniref:Uncharacterized protein n=1 Tax=Trichoderma citrinoviride TaxID=58853 RepID=A0A2T4AWM0_9HYPO|nr:hypothetical protein BBK36DRAFT_1043500 [Trichoderma citrinoviride]PTB61455.1 hypothetical protein BBK36DRAFT_1043500 [Trichoderma citrinoviride]